jgi:hypothetical protein
MEYCRTSVAVVAFFMERVLTSTNVACYNSGPLQRREVPKSGNENDLLQRERREGTRRRTQAGVVTVGERSTRFQAGRRLRAGIVGRSGQERGWHTLDCENETAWQYR